MCNYNRKFVKNYSKITKPVTTLLKKDELFIWTAKCQQAFEELKTKLTTSPILAYADKNRQYTITRDASDTAIGYILSQKDNQNRTRVIAYGGRSLSATERRYHTTEKESLAISNAIKTNDTYFSNNHFVVLTDYQALCWLQSTKHKSGRLLRLALQHYDFEVKHIKGKGNTGADALSRRTYADKQPDQDQMEDGPKIGDVFPIIDEPYNLTEVHLFYGNDPSTVLAALHYDTVTHPIESKPDLGELHRQCLDFQHRYAYLDQGILPDDNKLARKVNIESQNISLLNNILYHWYQIRTKTKWTDRKHTINR